MPMPILIVDDDPAILQGVATLLDQAGYTLQTAATGTEALAVLTQPPYPALVILDVMLPEVDGYQVCQHIRTLPSYIPILMLSARDELTDKITGLDLGADEYVTKPFEPRELLARVRAMLRFADQRSADPQAARQPLRCGPLTIWKDQRQVELQGQRLELTPKEWALLELFVEHPGQVFGRETLLRRIWGYDFLGDSRVVDVHVQRLRAKLEPEESAPRCIQTVRGFGYRFDPEGDRKGR